MKKKVSKALFLFAVIFAVSFSASAQIYVKVRPVFPRVEVRPAQPSPSHVWIDEEWQPRGHSYRYTGGHWAQPPHRGYIRTAGHWRHSNRGDVWVQGTWRRR
jgi:WXXGXW repeat (2 copies)